MRHFYHLRHDPKNVGRKIAVGHDRLDPLVIAVVAVFEFFQGRQARLRFGLPGPRLREGCIPLFPGPKSLPQCSLLFFALLLPVLDALLKSRRFFLEDDKRLLPLCPELADLFGVVRQHRQPPAHLLGLLTRVGQRILNMRFLGEEVNHFGLEFFNLRLILQGRVVQVGQDLLLRLQGVFIVSYLLGYLCRTRHSLRALVFSLRFFL